MRKYILLICLSFAVVESSEINSSIFPELLQLLINPISSKFICDRNFTVLGVSDGCSQQMKLICQNLDIAIIMLDASSKFPYAGMLYAGRLDLGNYDECMNIDFKDSREGRIFGKYCVGGLLIPDLKDPINIELMFKLAICIPNLCSAQDLINIGKSIDARFPPIFNDAYCTSRADENVLSIGNIITFVLIGLIALVMVLSTIVDYYLYKVDIKCTKPVLLAFSLFTNVNKLLKTSSGSSDQIHIFHGIKVISMLWIIAGHGFTIWQMGLITNVPMIPVLNDRDLRIFHTKMYSSYIDGGHFAVDTFFFISGFLLAYNYVKMKKASLLDQIKAVPTLYLHRFLRICPSVYMLFIVALWIFPKLGEGPLWKPAIPILADYCNDYWWSYFFFIQNYVSYDTLCMTHTWYLSADIQMFLLAPLILIPFTSILKRKGGFKISMYGLLVLITFSIALPIYFKLQFPDYTNVFDTHTRLVDYFMGIALAIYMRETKDMPFLHGVHEKLRSFINLVVWTFILLGMFASMLYYPDAEVFQGPTSKAYYYVLSRSAWCTGLAWLIYSCHHGYGGLINWILCRPIFQIVGRLTYSMYLTHFFVIGYHVLTNRERVFFSNYNQYFSWCGYFITTFAISLIWTLAFETPILVIEQVLIGKRQIRNTNGNTERTTHEGTSAPTETYRARQQNIE